MSKVHISEEQLMAMLAAGEASLEGDDLDAITGQGENQDQGQEGATTAPRRSRDNEEHTFWQGQVWRKGSSRMVIEAVEDGQIAVVFPEHRKRGQRDWRSLLQYVERQGLALDVERINPRALSFRRLWATSYHVEEEALARLLVQARRAQRLTDEELQHLLLARFPFASDWPEWVFDQLQIARWSWPFEKA